MTDSKRLLPPYQRPMVHKKSTRIILGGTLAGLIILLLKKEGHSPVVTQNKSLSPKQEETAKVFQEAAKKRFGIKKAPVLDLTPDKESADQVKETLTREVMIGQLISEALDHKPQLVALAKERTLEKNPKILSLTQKQNQEVYQSHFIVSNTIPCRDTYDQLALKVLPLRELFTTYCVDPHFDYPGGFDENGEVEIKVSAIDAVDHFEGLDHELDKLIKIELRSIIVGDFAKHYQATGRLTYVD